jgi:hypothetical protein
VKIVRKKGEDRGKKDPGEKKAFAFFHIEIIPSFSSLFSFVLLKSAVFPMIFMTGLR